MMNNARVNVGNQGVQIAERATQQALHYAKERIQSARAGSSEKTPVAIVEHPDVRRMLIRMRSLTEGARALLYYTAGQTDRGTLGDPDAKARADVLVPMIKAWGTDIGVEVASEGIQVHGGMGFVEETGAAQHYRDARIAPIYEGTNGIQAADLVTRKLALQGGAAFDNLFVDIARDTEHTEPALFELAQTCLAIAQWMRNEAKLDDRLAGSVPFIRMCAVAVAGWQMLRQRDAIGENDGGEIDAAKRVTVQFFLTHIVGEALGLKASVLSGSDLFYEIATDQLLA